MSRCPYGTTLLGKWTGAEENGKWSVENNGRVLSLFHTVLFSYLIIIFLSWRTGKDSNNRFAHSLTESGSQNDIKNENGAVSHFHFGVFSFRNTPLNWRT